ncbi:hypothetical protein HDU76_001119 [Blyttiomyces sp. JEL0837]|nr:hypothetical protein HDU76_001119 [Blyttiomyces sp. JEL0837]
MSFRNLGVVLGPGLFKPPVGMDIAWCVVFQWLIEFVGESSDDGDAEGMVGNDQVVKVIVTNESNETLVINHVDHVRDVEVVKSSSKKSGGGGGPVWISKISIEAVVNGGDNNDDIVGGCGTVGTGTPSLQKSCNSVEAVVGVVILGEFPPGVRVNNVNGGIDRLERQNVQSYSYSRSSESLSRVRRKV